MTNANNRQVDANVQAGEGKMKKTMRFLLSAALVLFVAAGLIPYTDNTTRGL